MPSINKYWSAIESITLLQGDHADTKAILIDSVADQKNFDLFIINSSRTFIPKNISTKKYVIPAMLVTHVSLNNKTNHSVALNLFFSASIYFVMFY